MLSIEVWVNDHVAVQDDRPPMRSATGPMNVVEEVYVLIHVTGAGGEGSDVGP
jgi:hypothetical protein